LTVLIVILVILFGAAFTFVSSAFLYSRFKTYFKTARSKKMLTRYVVVFISVAWGGAALMWFFMRGPAYFEQGIDQLHTSKYIHDKVGDFNSYSYYSKKLAKDPAKQAIFQVTINTDSLNLFLTCTMHKVGDDWKLIKIKEDSVRNAHP
jgi:hypothetical protein